MTPHLSQLPMMIHESTSFGKPHNPKNCDMLENIIGLSHAEYLLNKMR